MANEPWRQCWRTPKWLFDYVQLEIAPDNRRALDAFASREDTLANRYFDTSVDALTCRWAGTDWRGTDVWYWCNPPFRLAGKAVRHATEQVRKHDARVVMLLLARDLQASYIRDCADAWSKFLLTPRLGYVDPRTGKEERSPTFPSMLWVSDTIRTRHGCGGCSEADIAFDYLDTRPIREHYERTNP